MRTSFPTAALAVACLLTLLAPAASLAADFEGDWKGALKVSGTELPIVIHITAAGDGYSATLDSPSQGAIGIPVNEVEVEGSEIRLFIRPIGGTFTATLADEGSELDGTWAQNGLEFPLLMVRDNDSARKPRPQEPVEPVPYQIEEVRFPSAAEGVVLAGTLTRPTEPTGAPAVVLISGSGPQDRDHTLMGHRPFLVLADHLTRRGITVLRFDDRGVADSGGSFSAATTRDFADDALGAAAFLRGRGLRSVGLAGHSEGGLVAPMAAIRDPEIDFVVLLAAPGVPGRELLLSQAELLIRANGGGDREVALNQSIQTRIFDILGEEPFGDEQITALRGTLRDSLATVAPQASDEDLSRQIDNQMTSLTSAWFRLFLTYDPVPALRELRCAVLVLNGSKDLQVPAETNLPAITAALRQGGNSLRERRPRRAQPPLPDG